MQLFFFASRRNFNVVATVKDEESGAEYLIGNEHIRPISNWIAKARSADLYAGTPHFYNPLGGEDPSILYLRLCAMHWKACRWPATCWQATSPCNSAERKYGPADARHRRTLSRGVLVMHRLAQHESLADHAPFIRTKSVARYHWLWSLSGTTQAQNLPR